MQPAMLPLDAEGYLIEPSDWNEDVARELARRQEVDLGPDHREVIRFMREAWVERPVAPDARHAMRHLDERHPGKGRQRLFELFPYGYGAQACPDRRHEAAARLEQRADLNGVRPRDEGTAHPRGPRSSSCNAARSAHAGCPPPRRWAGREAPAGLK